MQQPRAWPHSLVPCTVQNLRGPLLCLGSAHLPGDEPQGTGPPLTPLTSLAPGSSSLPPVSCGCTRCVLAPGLGGGDIAQHPVPGHPQGGHLSAPNHPVKQLPLVLHLLAPDLASAHPCFHLFIHLLVQ